MGRPSAIPSKLGRYIRFNNRHPIQHILRLLLRFHLLVLAEMFDILRMNQVLLSRVLVVILLEMMDLILVLVIPVVAWPKPEIRQFNALVVAFDEFPQGDGVAVVLVVELDYLAYCFAFFELRDVVGGFVSQAVGFEDVLGCPLAAAVVVVEVEEGAGVE